MTNNKKEMVKFYVTKDSVFSPYEYREEEGNFPSGEYYPLKHLLIARFLLGVYK